MFVIRWYFTPCSSRQFKGVCCGCWLRPCCEGAVVCLVNEKTSGSGQGSCVCRLTDVVCLIHPAIQYQLANWPICQVHVHNYGWFSTMGEVTTVLYRSFHLGISCLVPCLSAVGQPSRKKINHIDVIIWQVHVLRCGIYRIYKCPDMFPEMVITLPIPWSTHLWIASLKENHGNVNTVRRLHHRLVIKGMDRIILETGNPNIGHIKKTHQTCVNCFILGINQFD